MSYAGLLASKATIWNLTESTSFGVTESTSFQSQYDCRIRKLSGREIVRTDRTTAIGTHRIYFLSTATLKVTDQIHSQGSTYQIIDVAQPFNSSSIHHRFANTRLIQ